MMSELFFVAEVAEIRIRHLVSSDRLPFLGRLRVQDLEKKKTNSRMNVYVDLSVYFLNYYFYEQV